MGLAGAAPGAAKKPRDFIELNESRRPPPVIAAGSALKGAKNQLSSRFSTGH
jgi:hypothetical protein